MSTENPNTENPNTENPKDAYLWGALCHLASLVGFLLALLSLPIPFSNLVGPLLVWLFKREQYDFVDVQGKESLNFQLSVTLYGFITGIVLVLVAVIYAILVLGLSSASAEQAITLFFAGGGAILAIGGLIAVFGLLGVLVTVLVIVAAVKANAGEVYRYPFTIRIIR